MALLAKAEHVNAYITAISLLSTYPPKDTKYKVDFFFIMALNWK